jgi:vacuolar protein 8
MLSMLASVFELRSGIEMPRTVVELYSMASDVMLNRGGATSPELRRLLQALFFEAHVTQQRVIGDQQLNEAALGLDAPFILNEIRERATKATFKHFERPADACFYLTRIVTIAFSPIIGLLLLWFLAFACLLSTAMAAVGGGGVAGSRMKFNCLDDDFEDDVKKCIYSLFPGGKLGRAKRGHYVEVMKGRHKGKRGVVTEQDDNHNKFLVTFPDGTRSRWLGVFALKSSGVTVESETDFLRMVMSRPGPAQEVREACSRLPKKSSDALAEMRERVVRDELPLLSLLQAEPLQLQSSHLSFQEYFTAKALSEEGTRLSGTPPWQWPAWWANVLVFGTEMGDAFGRGLQQAAGVTIRDLDGLKKHIGGDRVTALRAIALMAQASNKDEAMATAKTGGMVALVALAKDGTAGQKEASVASLLNLAHINADNRAAIIKAGGAAPIVALAKDGTEDQREQAAWALASLSVTEANTVAIVEADGMSPLLNLNTSGSNSQKMAASGALLNLAANNSENYLAIQKAGGIALIGLVALVENGTDRQKELAAAALSHLSRDADNRVAIARAGGIAPLAALSKEGNDRQKEHAAAALGHLLANDNIDKVAVAGGILPFVSLVKHGTDMEKELAARALFLLSINNPANRMAIGMAGGIAPLVVLSEDGTDGQREHAVAALGNFLSGNNIENQVAENGGISRLLKLANEGTDSEKEYAAGALFLLSTSNPTNRVGIVKAIFPLVSLAKGGTDGQRELAARVLFQLCIIASTTSMANAMAGALVTLAEAGTDGQKELAAAALSKLLIDPAKRLGIVQAGGIAPLEVLAKKGTDGQKEHAAAALSKLKDSPASSFSKGKRSPSTPRTV